MGGPSTMVIHVAPRGKDMPGLMRYLYGPGKANEHTDQRAVAASGNLVFAFSGALTAPEASELGRVVQAAWHEQMAEANALVGAGSSAAGKGAGRGAGRGGVSRASLKAGEGGVSDGEKEHTYHLIVSLPPGQSWSDQQWATVARDTVDGMGFTAGGDAHGSRWVAVHHGLSAGGNDHLHIAVDLVRQDGRRVNLPRGDFHLANQVRRTIEATRPFVTPLHDAGQAPARTLPGYTMAEHAKAKEAAARQGRDRRDGGQGAPDAPVIPDRVYLQQTVRAAAAAATTEQEWLNGLLDVDDVEVQPARWAVGGREEVTGYKVRRGDGVWFSASALAPDLTLSKLRPAWADHEDEASRTAAMVIWRADTDLPAVAPAPPAPTTLATAEEALAQWAADLADVDVHDGPAWAAATQAVAGVTSSLSRNAGVLTRPLTAVGQTLTRQALPSANQRPTGPERPALRPPPATSSPGPYSPSSPSVRPHFGPSAPQVAARHIQLALRASSVDSHPGWLAVLTQLRQVMQAIGAARHARDELAAARALTSASHDVAGAQVVLRQQLGGARDAGDAGDAALVEVWDAREASRIRTPATHARQGPAADTAPSSVTQPARDPSRSFGEALKDAGPSIHR